MDARKVANHCVFSMIRGFGGSKSRLAKAVGAEPCGQSRYKNGTPLWREAHPQDKCTKHRILGALLEVQMSKNGTRLWREAHFQLKMHKTPACSDHFFKLVSRKLAISQFDN